MASSAVFPLENFKFLTLFFSREQYLNRREVGNAIWFILFFIWLVFSYSLLTVFYLPVVFSVVSMFFGTAVFSYFVLVWLRLKHFRLIVFSLSLLISQSIWFLRRIPVNHWTVAATLLLLYFIIWDFIKLRSHGKLTIKIIIRDILFGIAGAGFIFLSSGIII